MAAQAIDNTNMKNWNGVLPAGFTPVLTYAYDADAATVIVTDGSTLGAGDTLKAIHVRVHDKFGGEVRDNIGALAGNTGTIDVSGLNRSKGLDITATITTAKMVAADGGAYGIGAAGSVANWDIQQNA
jgi:hypothetical protein